MTLTSDDMQLASGSEDASIRIWNVFNQQCIKIINMTCGISNLQFKPRNLFINDEANSETPLATVSIIYIYIYSVQLTSFDQ